MGSAPQARHPATPAPGTLSATPRTRHRRMREQGGTERGELFAVLDAGLVCHLGVVVDGSPMVVPTSYGYGEEFLYLHGSVVSRSLVAAPTSEVCATITVVDGLVLARSVFEHGVNYRCAMIYGIPRAVTDPYEKLEGLRLLTEHVAPGQWDYARRPSRKELAATTVVAIPLDEASVKSRSGPPSDADSPDAELGLWAGVLPRTALWDTPQPDPALDARIVLPPHLVRLTGTDDGTSGPSA